MRKLINIILENETPQVLYHGTSDTSWHLIQQSNEMLAMEGAYDDEDSDAICFTSSKEVAESFAREAVMRDETDGAEDGVVIVFSMEKLSLLGSLSEFHQDGMSTSWAHHTNEHEYRFFRDRIKSIMSAVTGHYEVKTQA